MKPETDSAANATAGHPQQWTLTPPPCAGYRVTNSGPPHERRTDMIRWWDGNAWSAPCYDDDPEHIKDRARITPSESPATEIEWLAPATA